MRIKILRKIIILISSALCAYLIYQILLQDIDVKFWIIMTLTNLLLILYNVMITFISTKDQAYPLGIAVKDEDEKENYLLVTRYHEAGHALLALICDFKPSEMNVFTVEEVMRTDSDILGNVTYSVDIPKIGHSALTIQQHIMVSLAGIIAEKIYLETSEYDITEYLCSGGHYDMDRAYELAQILHRFSFQQDYLTDSINQTPNILEAREEGIRAILHELEDETYSIVKEHFTLVELFAKEVEKTGTLTGQELIDMYNKYVESLGLDEE